MCAVGGPPVRCVRCVCRIYRGARAAAAGACVWSREQGGGGEAGVYTSTSNTSSNFFSDSLL